MVRMVWVSNRLAVRVVEDGAALQVIPSSGGLASALRDQQARSHAHWIGWPGHVSPERHAEVKRALAALDATPIFLTQAEVSGYYESFSNGVLWPILHGNLDKLPLDVEQSWRQFGAVNQRFADVCALRAEAGESLWLHDFHLALVPALVREQVPSAKIGFFLHVPFPPPEIFTALPRWRDIVIGLLGADLIGFHTEGFRDCFRRLLGRIGARVRGDVVDFAGHATILGVFPIGVDFEKLDRLAREATTLARADTIRKDARGRKIILGVDRLDYTKGIPRRFLAVERLFERWPALAESVQFIQVAVPTRNNVAAYAEFRPVVNELVGRINGRFGSPSGVPIHFIHREIPLDELLALYRAADVMLVTPLRDGMNLVCKEFVAARGDERGSLVLSEFAGAADELRGALLVNPFDLDDVARRIREAMMMPDEEQRVRMSVMRRVVGMQDVHRWAASFIDVLETAHTARSGVDRHLAEDLLRAADARHLHVLLDYDGTLVPIVETPSQADPDPELLALLRELADVPATSVSVVSGRAADVLEDWLGALPISLYAEHGAHERLAVGAKWKHTAPPPWKERAAAILTAISREQPGVFVEHKRCSLALHTRALPLADRARIDALAIERVQEAIGREAAILSGDCVIEVRDPTLHKGRVVRSLRLDDGDLVLVAGDDTTDDDLFAAVPRDSVVIGVGAKPRGPRHRVGSYLELRAILRRLIGARGRKILAKK